MAMAMFTEFFLIKEFYTLEVDPEEVEGGREGKAPQLCEKPHTDSVPYCKMIV